MAIRGVKVKVFKNRTIGGGGGQHFQELCVIHSFVFLNHTRLLKCKWFYRILASYGETKKYLSVKILQLVPLKKRRGL